MKRSQSARMLKPLGFENMKAKRKNKRTRSTNEPKAEVPTSQSSSKDGVQLPESVAKLIHGLSSIFLQLATSTGRGRTLLRCSKASSSPFRAPAFDSLTDLTPIFL